MKWSPWPFADILSCTWNAPQPRPRSGCFCCGRPLGSHHPTPTPLSALSLLIALAVFMREEGCGLGATGLYDSWKLSVWKVLMKCLLLPTHWAACFGGRELCLSHHGPRHQEHFPPRSRNSTSRRGMNVDGKVKGVTRVCPN